MAYSSLNFAAYADLRPEIDSQEIEDGTMRAMVHGENKALFDMLARIISGYVRTGQEQKLRVFFEMIEDGLNQSIEILTGETPPMPVEPPGT
jgi:hypothetical protein